MYIPERQAACKTWYILQDAVTDPKQLHHELQGYQKHTSVHFWQVEQSYPVVTTGQLTATTGKCIRQLRQMLRNHNSSLLLT